MIRLVTAIGDGTLPDVRGHNYGMMCALDEDDRGLAQTHATHLMANFDVIPNLYREPLRMDVAYYLGMCERKADEALKWLDDGMPSILTEEVDRLRARAACALAAEDADHAEQLARKALDTLVSYGEKANDPASHDWLNAILRQAEEMRTATAEGNV